MKEKKLKPSEQYIKEYGNKDTPKWLYKTDPVYVVIKYIEENEESNK